MIMAWRDREEWFNFVFCDDGRVVDEQERNGGWGWVWCGGYERIWEIKGTTCQIGLGRPSINEITHRIRTRTCRIRDGEMTRTWHSLSPSVSSCFAPSLLISLLLVLNSAVTQEHEVKSSLSISPCHDQVLTANTAYTEYSIHWVLHTPRTASSQDWLSPAPSQSLSSQRTLLYSILYIPTITS